MGSGKQRPHAIIRARVDEDCVFVLAVVLENAHEFLYDMLFFRQDPGDLWLHTLGKP
jgi:hypothetical protein